MSRKPRFSSEPPPLLDIPRSTEPPPADDVETAIGELDLIEVDDEVTLTMRADETRRLIEAAFGDAELERPSTDDEITLDVPSPSSSRLSALRMLPIKPPPSSSRPPPLPRVRRSS